MIDLDDVAGPLRPRSSQPAVGASLEALSISELEARICELEAEIQRVRAEIERKRSIAAAADSVFGARSASRPVDG
ncbi:MAG: DUF1192 family protein [Hyphomicrobiaceae bacterium]